MNTPTATSRPTTTAPALTPPLDATALAALDPRDFYATLADTNTTYAAAATAYQAAATNLTLLLTEQIARHAHKTTPHAAYLAVAPTTHDHCDTGCAGHTIHLAPIALLDTDHNLTAIPDPLSPLTYLMERLTPFLGLEPQVLDLTTRDWAPDYAA